MKQKHIFKKLSLAAFISSLSISAIPAVSYASPVTDEDSAVPAAEEAVSSEAASSDALEADTSEADKKASNTDKEAAPAGLQDDTSPTASDESASPSGVTVQGETKVKSSVPETTASDTDTNNDDKAYSGVGETKAASKTAARNGWQYISGKYYYYKNNKNYTGWHYMTSAEGEKKPHWSYFGSDGALRTGWIRLGKGTSEPDGNSAVHWSYFGDNGWLRTGWVQLGKGTSEPDGNSAKHWSYFGDNGWLRTGWVQLGKGTGEPDGNTPKHWSYFGNNGWLRTGWVQLGQGTAEPDGNTARHWSYFGDNGWLRTEWQHLGQGTDNPDGNSPAHISYFGSNGWLVTGKRTINNTAYTFDDKGWLIQGSVSLSSTNIDIDKASSSSNQLVADGCYRISPVKNTNYSIDVYGESAADNTKIWSYANNNTSAQFFQIKHLGNNIYSIKTGASIYDSGWDISGGKAVKGASVVQKKYTGASTQKWKIVSAGDDSYTFKPASADLAVDIEGGKLSEGTVKLAAPTGSNTQKFKLSKASGFLIRNGRKYYFNENGDKPMIGVDVSAWSETVDWAKVKADGIEFAIIRASHRGGQVDKYAKRNMSECTRLGIPFGVYCYSYATTNAEADHEVDTLLSAIKGYNPKVGVFIDIEDNDTYQKAFGDIYAEPARRKITDLTKRMVNRVQNAGYLAGVYGNDIYLNKILYLNELPNVRWVAKYYTNKPDDTNVIDLAGKGYKIWQFTGAGTVNGIPNAGWSDLNTVIEKYW